MKRLKVCVCVCVATFFTSAGWASHTLSHLQVDLRYDLVMAINPFEDHLVDTGCLNFSSPGNCGKWGNRDQVLVKALVPFANFPACPDCVGPNTNLNGSMFVSEPDLAGDLVLTTFYGFDADPGSANDFALTTGFDSVNPEVSFSDETYIGLTQNYPATSLGTFQIGELGLFFPDFDFSSFVGDPGSIVYAFSGVVPTSDLARIPEPSALLLAGLAVAGIAVRRRILR